MRSDKALRNAFRRLQLPIADDPKAVMSTVVSAIPADVRDEWDNLEGDDGARIAFAFAHPQVAHLLTAGVTLPTFREELEWVLRQFDAGLPDGDVLDVGAGAGVTAAVLALATKRHVTACEPATGAAAAISNVAALVGTEVETIEAPTSRLTIESTASTRIAIAQSILSYLGFGFETKWPERAAEQQKLLQLMAAAGDALVIEHVLNVEDQTSTWQSFVTGMTDSGMHPVWDTAFFASGYNVFTPDVPAHERDKYKRPKLCLRFSRSGDSKHAAARMNQLLGQVRGGPAWPS